MPPARSARRGQLVPRRATADRYLVDACSRRAATRPQLFALYAFNAEIARVRDIVSEPLPGEIRYQWWRDAARGAGEGRRRRQPGRCRAASTPSSALNLPPGRSCRPDRGADLRSLRRSDADVGDLEGYCGETSSALIRLATLDPRRWRRTPAGPICAGMPASPMR